MITAPSPNGDLIYSLNGDPIYSPDATSAYLGGRIATQTLARWRCEGRGPEYVKLSTRRVGYRKSAIDLWLSTRGITPNATREQ